VSLFYWYDIILNVHVTTEDKSDDRKDSFCEELECVFDKCPKYYVKIVLRVFSAKVEREDIFKPTVLNKSYTNLLMVMGVRVANCHIK
jgi:hypothetical protein